MARVRQIDMKGMDVAQPIWLLGCPTKCRISAKNTKYACINIYDKYVKLKTP